MEYEKIVSIISEQFNISESEITPNMSLIDDLGADSLELVDLVMALEEEFEIEIPEDDFEDIKTVADAVEYAKTHCE